MPLVGKNPPARCRKHKKCGFDCWVGKIPWRRKCNPFHYSCLENSMDREAWQTIVHRVAKSWTWLKWLSTYTILLNILPKVICMFSELPTKMSMAFFTELEQIILNIVWNHKWTQIAKAILGKKTTGSITLLDFRLHYKAVAIKTVWSEVKLLSRVQLFVTPWTVAYYASLSMGFSRQEYWSRLPFPSPGDLPNSGIKSRSSALQADALPSEPLGKLQDSMVYHKNRSRNQGKRIESPEISPCLHGQLICDKGHRICDKEKINSVQSLSHVRCSVTPWTVAHQASLFITNSQSLLKLLSIELVIPSNYLILCRPLLLLPSLFPSIRVFSNESSSYQVAKVLESASVLPVNIQNWFP